MSKRHHIIISGTGRAGTTFIISVLTKLDLDTGFSVDDLDKGIDKNGRAGLESNIRSANAPYIVKSPNLANYIDEVIEDDSIVIDHLFVPIRDIEAATQSRVFVSKSGKQQLPFYKRLFKSSKGYAGGLFKADNSKEQERVLLKMLSNLLVGIAATDVPVTFIQYPKLTNDAQYLFDKLQPMLKDISYADFEKVYTETLKPEWVHEFSKRDQ